VINFEPPWNPARLEQRIGRVHRLGQSHPVHVVHMLTRDTIEMRVWETLRLKKSLFAGVFDSPTGEVSFAALGRKSVLQAVKEIFADQPQRPKPEVEQPAPKPIPVQPASGFEQSAAALIQAGVQFLSSLAASPEKLSNVIARDPRTNRPTLSIPLPQSVEPDRLMRAFAAFLGEFTR